MHTTLRQFLLGLLSASSCLASVTTTHGTVNGVIDESNGVHKFLGIPFAQPPVEKWRLRQAVPLQESFGTIEADAFGASCYSTDAPGNMSEDCLTLNIWKPLGTSAGNGSLPVMVWLYGGGLTAGYTVGILVIGRL